MSARRRKRPYVAFEWLDAVSSDGWAEGTGHRADLCVATGTVIERTRREITLAIATGTDPDSKLLSNARMTIPLRWIEGPIHAVGWVVEGRLKLNLPPVPHTPAAPASEEAS